MTLYTAGWWRAKPGHEAALADAWRLLAERTAAEFPGAHAELLRDRDDPARFLSVGPWTAEEDVDRWRASATFQQGMAAIRPHLEAFEPHTLDLAAAVGSTPRTH